MGAIETLPFNKTPTEHTPVGGVHGSFFVTAVSMEVLGVRNDGVFMQRREVLGGIGEASEFSAFGEEFTPSTFEVMFEVMGRRADEWTRQR